MKNYLTAAAQSELRGLRSDMQDALKKLERRDAQATAQLRPVAQLPWMRSVVANGDKGVAWFDITFYDMNTDARVQVTAEAARGAIQYLENYAAAMERKDGRMALGEQAPTPADGSTEDR